MALFDTGLLLHIVLWRPDPEVREGLGGCAGKKTWGGKTGKAFSLLVALKENVGALEWGKEVSGEGLWGFLIGQSVSLIGKEITNGKERSMAWKGTRTEFGCFCLPPPSGLGGGRSLCVVTLFHSHKSFFSLLQTPCAFWGRTVSKSNKQINLYLVNGVKIPRGVPCMCEVLCAECCS